MLAAETAVGDALVLVGAGVDPHKASNTIAVLDGDEVLLDCRFPNTRAGIAAMVNAVVAWPDRRCAVEGARGMGHHLAQRLVAADEVVVDVSAKLATRGADRLDRPWPQDRS